MRFGLGPLTTGPIGGKKLVDAYEEALEQAGEAERWGFDSVWVGEDYFSRQSLNASSSVLGAAVARRTVNARVGFMPTLGLSHAIYLAEEAAAIDNLSNGRVVVGAQLPSVLARRGWRLPADKAQARCVDDLRVMRLSWGPAPFSYESDFYRIPGRNPVHIEAAGYHKISVQPKPSQLQVPLWVVGGEDAAAVAADSGTVFCAAPWLAIDELTGPYGEVPADGRTVPIIRNVFVAPTAAEAEERAEQAVGSLYEAYREQGLDRLPADIGSLRDRFVIGDPKSCIEQIERYRDGLGVNYMVARVVYPAETHATAIEAIRLFGTRVVPAFRMYGLAPEILYG